MTPILKRTRPRRGALIAAPREYGFDVSSDIERRMRRCRASIRNAIHKRLGEIAASAGKSRREAKAAAAKEPPLRFYVYEGYRIAYQIDARSRRVVVLDLELLPVD
jgi:mRNA-degrading endonuclease RelE of RelBE toxin-antitoxin system